MSDDHFHVHGPHDHALEHVAEHGGGDNFSSRIAVMTAILSTIGALFSYQGGATQNAAMLFKNEAAINKTEAANQWSFYQAKSAKENLAELGAALGTDPAKTAQFQSEAARYQTEKSAIKLKAEALEAKVLVADQDSEAAMHQHHRWAQSMTLIQIAIALAAITLLTRKSWLQTFAYGAGIVGILIGVLAALHI